MYICFEKRQTYTGENYVIRRLYHNSILFNRHRRVNCKCARINLVFSAGEIPALEREKPAHLESSLGLMEVTT